MPIIIDSREAAERLIADTIPARKCDVLVLAADLAAGDLIALPDGYDFDSESFSEWADFVRIVGVSTVHTLDETMVSVLAHDEEGNDVRLTLEAFTVILRDES